MRSYEALGPARRLARLAADGARRDTVRATAEDGRWENRIKQEER